MRLPLRFALVGLAATSFSSQAFAQEILEDRQVKIEEKEKETKLTTQVFFETEWHEYNNIDFRTLDESSDQAILDSDDRTELAFTGAGVTLQYRADDFHTFNLSASHQGLWGNDQVGLVNGFGGLFYFNALNADLTVPNLGLRFLVGRQAYSIGVLPDNLEFIYRDIVDQIRVDIPIGKIGKVVLIPVNITALAAQDDATFMSYVGQADIETFGFRGDRVTRRHGAQLIIDELPIDLNISAYAFYTDIGSLGSGSDITYDGLLGNFADNDWVANAGVRASYDFGAVTPFASFDGSYGVDRKELVAPDVDMNGYAVMGGVDVDTSDKDDVTKKGFRAQAAFFTALGPAYKNDGMQFSHGYMGLKARQIGGTLANRYLGWHPTAYVGTFGVNSNPNDMSRTAGTMFVVARGGYDFGRFDFRLHYWWMRDTSFTDLNQNDIDGLMPPYGYSRDEFRAQARSGKTLGHEINLDLNFAASKFVNVYANGAVIVPGGFYAIQIPRVAGTALGSPTPAMPWGMFVGTNVSFK